MIIFLAQSVFTRNQKSSKVRQFPIHSAAVMVGMTKLNLITPVRLEIETTLTHYRYLMHLASTEYLLHGTAVKY